MGNSSTKPSTNISRKKLTKNGTNDGNPIAVWVVKILLIILILLLLPRLVIAKRRSTARSRKNVQGKPRTHIATKVLQNTRLGCEMDEPCASMIPEEAMDCIQRCSSPVCYEQIYATQPLEWGEIDIDRAREFDKCKEAELREERRQERSGSSATSNDTATADTQR